MSLHPDPIGPIPDQTARVARAAFPKGTLCLKLYDEIGTIFCDQDFADLFPQRGQPRRPSASRSSRSSRKKGEQACSRQRTVLLSGIGATRSHTSLPLVGSKPVPLCFHPAFTAQTPAPDSRLLTGESRIG